MVTMDRRVYCNARPTVKRVQMNSHAPRVSMEGLVPHVVNYAMQAVLEILVQRIMEPAYMGVQLVTMETCATTVGTIIFLECCVTFYLPVTNNLEKQILQK